MTRPRPHRLVASLSGAVLPLLAVLAALSVTVGSLVVTSPPATAGPTRGQPAGTGSVLRTADPPRATPLRVTLRTLAPGTIPRRGPVVLTGRIVNTSDQTWTDLNVYLVTSPTPLRSRAELAEAAGSDAGAEIGDRRAGPGLFEEVPDLAPGQSAAYRLTVRRADLGISGDPGVYWVGVHVLGASPDGRDLAADGRARTFMPLLPAPGTAAGARDRTQLALLVQVRKPVQRGSAGRLVDTGSWSDTLARDGRLDRLLSLTGTTREPLTTVVDPAVLDAVRSLSLGNPTADPPAGAGASGGPSPGPSASAGDGAQGPAEVSSRTARRARAWLRSFRQQSAGRTVATVPYGDLDVATALDSGATSVYRLGTRLSAETMSGLGVEATIPVVDPASGVLPEAALRRVDRGSPVVVADSALPESAAPVVRRRGVAPIVLTDTAAGGGGPSPNSQYAALTVRQRLLSEAALHALSSDRDQPLVVSLPVYWNPGDAWANARFFSGLSTSWLRLVDLPSVVATAPRSPRPESLVYPDQDRAERLPVSNLVATRSLVATADVFDRLLTARDPVDQPLDKIAMLASSSTARPNPALARGLAEGATAYVRGQMAAVRVEGPQFVMMSGESGPIQVTLVNGLRQSVTVGITVSTPGSDVRIADVRPVTLGAGRRTSIRLEARSDDIGVHSVTLTPSNADGVPLGTSTRLSVRTSNVSTVIWVIMAIGGALLFVAISVRLLRRMRVRKATHGPRLMREMSV